MGCGASSESDTNRDNGGKYGASAKESAMDAAVAKRFGDRNNDKQFGGKTGGAVAPPQQAAVTQKIIAESIAEAPPAKTAARTPPPQNIPVAPCVGPQQPSAPPLEVTLENNRPKKKGGKGRQPSQTSVDSDDYPLRRQTAPAASRSKTASPALPGGCTPPASALTSGTPESSPAQERKRPKTQGNKRDGTGKRSKSHQPPPAVCNYDYNFSHAGHQANGAAPPVAQPGSSAWDCPPALAWAPSGPPWECNLCGNTNAGGTPSCMKCGTANEAKGVCGFNLSEGGEQGALMAAPGPPWECKKCHNFNPKIAHCIRCGATHPEILRLEHDLEEERHKKRSQAAGRKAAAGIGLVGLATL